MDRFETTHHQKSDSWVIIGNEHKESASHEKYHRIPRCVNERIKTALCALAYGSREAQHECRVRSRKYSAQDSVYKVTLSGEWHVASI